MKIVNKPSISIDRCREWLKTKKECNEIVFEILDIIWEASIRNGVDPCVLLAQSLIETDYFMSEKHVKNHNTGSLKDVNYNLLTQIKGIKQAKAIEVLAIVELAKRLQKQPANFAVIKEPLDGYEYVKNKLMFEQQEKVLVLCLNSRLEVIKEKTVFIGSNNISIISSRELFKEALICGSSRIVIIHNHPSGNPEPSVEDIEATKKIFSIAKKLDIEVVDHLIIGRNKFYSFQINKVIEV